MSDVVVNVVESATNVTVTEQDVAVDVTETVVEVSVSTAGIQGVPGANNDPTYVTVRNATGATLPKGTIVYISGANGNNVRVTPAIATSDATSARTLGWLSAAIANNASGLCMVEGYLEGINTQSFNAGDQLYLSGTVAGGFTATKPQAPIHLVYVGVVTKKSAGDGHVFVKVQNGYELGELHDVRITSPANNDVLTYDLATDLWINKVNAADGVTSITATAPLTGGTITSTGSIGLDQAALSITKSQVSDFTSGTVTSASTAQQSGTAVYAVNSGTAVYSTTSGTALTITGDITKSQVTDFTSGTVASAGTAQQSGTAVYSVSSGTAVSISGSITQSQVTNLTTDLAAKAPLASPTFTGNVTLPFTNSGIVHSGTAGLMQVSAAAPGLGYIPYTAPVTGLYAWQDISLVARDNTANAFTVGGHSITNDNASTIPLYIQGAASQSVNLQEWRDSSGNILSRISQLGSIVFPVSGSFISGQTGGASIVTALPTTVAMVVRGAASQSANLFEIQNSGGTILSRFSSSGQLVSDQQAYIGSGAASIANTRFNVATGSASVVGAVIRGAASQSVDYLQVQNSAGAVVAKVDSIGDITARVLRSQLAARIATNDVNVAPMVISTVAGQVSNNTEWQTNVGVVASVNALGYFAAPFFDATVTNAGLPAFRARLASGQTGDGLQILNNASQPLSGFTSGGRFVTGITGSGFTALTSASLGQSTIYASGAAVVGQVIRGAASQTANLLELQNSAGTVVSRVSNDGSAMFGNGNMSITQFGAIFATSIATNVGRISMQEVNSGGRLTITKQTAIDTNPGADIGRIYFRDGTVPGTLKLVVRAGAAGAETTILDNIPQ
jgi:hypothetical protein